MAIELNVTLSKSVYVDESPYSVTPGDVRSFQFNIHDIDVITNDASLTTKIYQNNEDLSGSLLTGTMALPEFNSITSKQITGLTGGASYTLEVNANADGQVMCCGKVVLDCIASGE